MSGKHSQQDARKYADGLNSERKFGKTLASMQTGEIYVLIKIYMPHGIEVLKWKWTSICHLTWAILQLSNLRYYIIARKLDHHICLGKFQTCPFPQPLGIKFCQEFVILLVWCWGICQKTSARGRPFISSSRIG